MSQYSDDISELCILLGRLAADSVAKDESNGKWIDRIRRLRDYLTVKISERETRRKCRMDQCGKLACAIDYVEALFCEEHAALREEYLNCERNRWKNVLVQEITPPSA